MPHRTDSQAERLLAEFCADHRFSRREREVFALICKGLKNTAIATKLGISATTVRLHITNIHKKLDTQGKVDMALQLWRYSLKKHGGC